MVKHYENDADMLRHLNAMHSLEVQTGIPADEIANIYEPVLEALEAGARVKTFLPILTARKVKEIIGGRGGMH